jgi:hypothetical protein
MGQSRAARQASPALRPLGCWLSGGIASAHVDPHVVAVTIDALARGVFLEPPASVELAGVLPGAAGPAPGLTSVNTPLILSEGYPETRCCSLVTTKDVVTHHPARPGCLMASRHTGQTTRLGYSAGGVNASPHRWQGRGARPESLRPLKRRAARFPRTSTLIVILPRPVGIGRAGAVQGWVAFDQHQANQRVAIAPVG